jgi:hypothetical protein
VQVLGGACLLKMVKIFDFFTSSTGLFCKSYTVCIKESISVELDNALMNNFYLKGFLFVKARSPRELT